PGDRWYPQRGERRDEQEAHHGNHAPAVAGDERNEPPDRPQILTLLPERLAFRAQPGQFSGALGPRRVLLQGPQTYRRGRAAPQPAKLSPLPLRARGFFSMKPPNRDRRQSGRAWRPLHLRRAP